MFCPKCGEHNNEGAEFCSKCGANLGDVSKVMSSDNVIENSNLTANNEVVVNDKKKSNLLPIIIVIFIVIVGIGFGISKFLKKDNSNTNIENNNISSDNQNSKIDDDKNENYDKDGNFLMSIEDVFSITGRGTVATGRVLRGSVKVGDKVQVIGLDQEIITTEVVEIQAFRQSLEYADAGSDAGLYLKDVEREDILRGQVIAKPNSIKAYKKFDADIYFYSTKEGGRATAFFANYRPQFYFRTVEITGGITLPSGIEMVEPGTDIKLTVELEHDVAMEVGDTFDVRENGRTAGKGTVTKIY